MASGLVFNKAQYAGLCGSGITLERHLTEHLLAAASFGAMVLARAASEPALILKWPDPNGLDPFGSPRLGLSLQDD